MPRTRQWATVIASFAKSKKIAPNPVGSTTATISNKRQLYSRDVSLMEGAATNAQKTPQDDSHHLRQVHDVLVEAGIFDLTWLGEQDRHGKELAVVNYSWTAPDFSSELWRHNRPSCDRLADSLGHISLFAIANFADSATFHQLPLFQSLFYSAHFL
jgi:hypothetical protein